MPESGSERDLPAEIIISPARTILLSHARDSGQAVIEFVLVMFIVLTMLLFLIQITLFLSFGNYVQYATFMSARAYLSAWPRESDQVDHAERVLNRTVKRASGTKDRLPWAAVGVPAPKGAFGAGSIKGADIGRATEFPGCSPTNDGACDETLSWMEGVRYSFKGRVFQFAPNQMDPAASDVTLTSESFLGREPTYDECTRGMLANAIFDNGC